MKNIIFFVIFLIVLVSCRKDPIVYKTKAKINRLGYFRWDKYNQPLLVDLEIMYYTCPGTQIETVRSGKKIANCLSDYKVGDKIDLEIEWKWDSMGYYNWYVTKIAGCDREIDKEDEGSFNQIAECHDLQVYGVTVGFKCDRIPDDVLIEKCPWFKRD
jgi:hypothetical protein